jgi:hypothetical protein
MSLEIREVAGFGTSESRAIIGLTIMFLVISTVSVIGRFISRQMKRVFLGVDDWLMLAGLVRLIALMTEICWLYVLIEDLDRLLWTFGSQYTQCVTHEYRHAVCIAELTEEQ